MADDLKKSRATLGGVPLAATAPIVWRFTTGASPYVAVYTVHRSAWEDQLEQKLGTEVELEITASNGKQLKIQKLTILHIVPTDDTARVSFAVADLRYKWASKFISRDFNEPRRSGSRTAFQPGENQVVTNNLAYRPATMNAGEPWTARDALSDVLEELTTSWQIDSWPLSEARDDVDLQGVTLRDPGHVAVEILLQYIPGTVLWIDEQGTARVGNATDILASDRRWTELETRTIEGEPGDFIDRRKIRPRRVRVYFERELEVLLRARDNWQSTQSSGNPTEGYLENVLPTVDRETEVDLWDPEANAFVRRVVPPGTWVPVRQWLEAMDRIRPSSSYPWTWETIRELWIVGDLEGALGARFGVDDNKEGLVSERVAALRQHFRQTWRLSQAWMDRISSIAPIRVGLLDPISGERQPASVWGECCYILGPKGFLIADPTDPASGDVYSNRTWRDRLKGAPSVVKIEPSAASLTMLDDHIGLFRIDYRMPASGAAESVIPCNTTNGDASSGRVGGPWRDLREQDLRAMGPGFRVEGNEAGVLLRDRLDVWVCLTLIPGAPNHKSRCHSIDVEPSDLLLEYGAANYGEGEGDTLEIYVPPANATARFAWDEDGPASASIVELLGLNEANPGSTAGGRLATAEELPGFVWTNRRPELEALARAIAAEQLLPYADGIQGTVVTTLDPSKANLVGAMGGVEVQVSPFPDGAVRMIHHFPGQAPPISRFGLLPSSVRRVLLRTIGGE